MSLFVLVHPRLTVAIGTFDSRRAAAAYKGRHPEFKAGVIVPLWAESEATFLHKQAAADGLYGEFGLGS